MTYFRIDDTFWSHPKTYTVSMAARGLWATAGAWSCCYLTDGYIPTASLKIIAGGTPTKRLVDELVTAGLWIDVGDGWQFHQWAEHNYTKDQVHKQRERRRKNQEVWRTKKEMRAVLKDVSDFGRMP